VTVMDDAMRRMGSRWMVCWALALMGSITAALSQTQFPFEREMLLDVKPLPGSKRVPILEVMADGRATVDLWCRSGEGRAEVAGDTVRFALGPMREDGCTPERLQRDEDIAVALEQVTHWRIENSSLVLIGPVELRYRLSTH
jgi:heat shock protein HslJ